MFRKHLLPLLAAVAMAGIGAPAFADIKAFNAAIARGDFKAAVAAANETWPTLDKTRGDIALIAREFGFAAMQVEDYRAAATYAQAAVDAGPAADSPEISMVLLRLAQFDAAPNAKARSRIRDPLYDAIDKRAAAPGVDRITLMGLDALSTFDLAENKWGNLGLDGALGFRLMSAGGGSSTPMARQYQFYQAMAGYLVDQTAPQFEPLLRLKKAIEADIDAAPTLAEAKAFAPVYWMNMAWTDTIISHLSARGQGKETSALINQYYGKRPDGSRSVVSERVLLATGRLTEDKACRRKMTMSVPPKYPRTALMAGAVGTVHIELDITADGKSRNARIIAAAPGEGFGKAVLKMASGLRFAPGAVWNPAKCQLAKTGHMVTFNFLLGS